MNISRSPRLAVSATIAIVMLLSLMLAGCTEKRVVRQSGIYTSQQIDNIAPGAQPMDTIQPSQRLTNESQDKFDPLGDLWKAISSPFESKPTNTVTWENSTFNVPKNMTGDIRARGRDGQMYNLQFEQGQMKSAVPMQQSGAANRAPAAAPASNE